LAGQWRSFDDYNQERGDSGTISVPHPDVRAAGRLLGGDIEAEVMDQVENFGAGTLFPSPLVTVRRRMGQHQLWSW